MCRSSMDMVHQLVLFGMIGLDFGPGMVTDGVGVTDKLLDGSDNGRRKNLRKAIVGVIEEGGAIDAPKEKEEEAEAEGDQHGEWAHNEEDEGSGTGTGSTTRRRRGRPPAPQDGAVEVGTARRQTA